MTEEKKNTIDDHIDVLLTEGQSMGHQELVDKIDDLYKQNMHKAYDKYAVNLIRTKDFGWTLFFDGTRNETKEETEKREKEGGIRRKQIEEAELKEYLRLKKKYGKKDEQ